MNLWPCWICRSESVCQHREMELLVWRARLEEAKKRAHDETDAVGLAKEPTSEPTKHKPYSAYH